MKKSKVVPCINCNRGAYAKYRVCVDCGAEKVRVKHRFIFIAECRRVRDIEID